MVHIKIKKYVNVTLRVYVKLNTFRSVPYFLHSFWSYRKVRNSTKIKIIIWKNFCTIIKLNFNFFNFKAVIEHRSVLSSSLFINCISVFVFSCPRVLHSVLFPSLFYLFRLFLDYENAILSKPCSWKMFHHKKIISFSTYRCL